MKSKKLAVVLSLLACVSFVASASATQTIIFYQVNATDAAQVASGSVPNLGTLGNGTFGGTGVTLTNDIPVNGVPAGYGSAAIVCSGSGGVLAPGTEQLSRTNIANAGGFTYEAWFKWNGSGNNNCIIDYAGTEKLIRRVSDSGPTMETDNATFSLIGAADSNQWHYVAVVFTPTNTLSGDTISGKYTFYLDTNVPLATVLGVTLNSFGDSLNRTIGVGTHPVPSFTTDFFHGLIYEPRVTLGARPASGLLFRPTVMVTTNGNSGPGSLRAAVASTMSPILVHFDPSLSGQTITLTSGPIVCLGDNVNIDASSLPDGITISGNNNSTIISVQDSGQFNNTVVALNSLTLVNGNDNHDGTYGGGALFSDASVFVNNCTFTGNQADSSAGGGGAIYAFGAVTIVNNCTFSGNHANGSSFIGSTTGGAISGAGPLALNNCTFTANQSGVGGAVASDFSVVINNCTFAGNNGTTGGALWNGSGSTMFITNTILFSNTPGGSGPEIFSSGNSSPNPPSLVCVDCLFGPENNSAAISSTTPNFTVTSPVNTTNPHLSPLASDGGPTPTMPPLPGSPALDNGSDSVLGVLATDQRGFPRKVGSHVDIGAVEFEPGATNLVVTGAGDDGPGSLRQAILDAVVYETGTPKITFATALAGQTITLASEIPINNNIAIDASALPGGLTLSGGGQTRILSVLAGTTSLTNLVFTGGNGVGSANNGSGGAIYDQATLSLTQCTLSNNSALGAGGALLVLSTATLSQCTLSGNQSGDNGGAIFGGNGSFLTLSECTLAYNTSYNYGGALAVFDGTANLLDCTLAGSIALTAGGGGIDNNVGNVSLTGCILAGNTSSQNAGAGLYNADGQVTASHVLIDNNADSGIGATNGNLTGTAGSPINARLAPLGPWGGPTLTMPPLPGSPAIDAGSYHGNNIDQRGSARFIGSNPDMGAVESGGLWVQTNFDTGSTSLRSIIAFAQGVSGPYLKDVIFVPTLSGADVSLSSQLLISDPNGTVIDGSALPGGVQIDPAGHSRAFYITNGAHAVLKSLNIINGLAPVANIINGGGGGAIFCQGSVTVLDCLMTNNRVINGAPGSIAAVGGAVVNNGGSVAMTNCTLAFNQAVNAFSPGAEAGAFYNLSGTMILDHCTVASNTATSAVNGGFADGGSTRLHATVLANGNVDFTNLQGGVSLGDNFIADGRGCGFTNGVNGDQIGTNSFLNALLASVGRYGGPTPTMPPLPGSPLVDAGGPPGIATDQRGYPRLLGIATDIGAVEGIYNTVPGKIVSIMPLGDGSIVFIYTNLTDENFAVLASPSVTQPMSNWVQIGFTTETQPGSGQFLFIDPQAATNQPQRYYRVVSY